MNPTAHASRASDWNAVDVPPVDDGNSGLIVVDQRAKLQYVSRQAHKLLFLATHPQVSAETLAALGTKTVLPAVVLQVCRNLVDVFEGKPTTAGPPVWHHQNPRGGFSFRAYWLDQGRLNRGSAEPSPLIGITIQHEAPLAVKLIARLSLEYEIKQE